MAESDTCPIWKKIYHTVTDGNTLTTGDVVDQILGLCKGKLVAGLLQYPFYNKESFQPWKDNPGLKEFVSDTEMCNFIHTLSKDLNLEVNSAWIVLCNYLMYDYFGKIDELKSIIRYDTNLKSFIDNVWYFYTADRMFLLKTLRHIFEKVHDDKYVYQQQFDKFLKSIDANIFWNNLVKAFEGLITEIDSDRVQLTSVDSINRWIHRNNREQVEVGLLLVHATKYCTLDGNELEKVLSVFIKHGFTRHPMYRFSNSISRPADIVDIKYVEVGCVLTILERYWKQPGIAKMLPKNLEQSMELIQMQGDNSIILFAWAVLKTSIDPTEETMEYCNTTACNLGNKRLFVTIYRILINKLFAKSKAGDLVIDGVFQLMVEFIKLCADYSCLHEQEGICYVVAELIKRKGGVVLDYLGPMFQLAIDAFPFLFTPFLEMCKALIELPEYYDNIMKLLKKMPGYVTEIPWNNNKDSYLSVEPQNIFIDCDLFEIPAGTPVEKFVYKGMFFARYMYPYSFFALMEQFVRCLFGFGQLWNGYDNLAELVEVGYLCVSHILKHYKGDFRSDTSLRRLITRLEVIPAQILNGPTRNFEFLRIYMEINVTLVTRNMLDFSEAFPLIVRKQFFPQLPSYTKVKHHLVINQIYNESTLFKCLKEEEGMTDHTLLIEYLKLIEDLLKKEVYHKEVTLAGVWYVLNVVFPLHQQWPYEDDQQMILVCKYCVSIFVNVLQSFPPEDNEAAVEIFDMCRDGFLHEEVLISSYLSVFYKDKFYMLNLMERESNWISGPVLDYINYIRLQMTLLLLIYKLSLDMPDKKKSALNSKIDAITRAVSGFMVNPYCTALRILSFRFLEVLAGDEDVPLMALLGLDYDQIQRLFLDKLRDPLEDDSVKLHILGLISNCIFHQHGMTAAFFNVKRSRRWYSDNKEKTIEGDTVTDFMIDYLQNIKKSHKYLKYPLQQAILCVMTNLWTAGKHHLIKDIVALDAFWPLLVDPMFRDFTQKSIVYAYILKILSIQLNEEGPKDPKFLKIVEKFVTNEQQLTLWQKYIFQILQRGAVNRDDVEEKETLLKCWMEFVLMVEENRTIKKLADSKTKYLFVQMCLDGFNHSLANLYCLETWLNLCLIHISRYGLRFEGKDDAIVSKFVSVLGIVKPYYMELNHDSRAIIVTLALKVVEDLKSHFQNYTPSLLEFLEQLGILMELEHTIVEESVWKELKELGPIARNLLIPWSLYINIVNIVLKYSNVAECGIWFSYRNYLAKIVKYTCDLFDEKETLPLGKLGIQSLTLYMESPLFMDFMNVNVMTFYDKLEPHVTHLLSVRDTKINPLTLEDGWTTYTLLMKFNIAFLKKFQITALQSLYAFMGLHEDILQQVLLIPDVTVSLKALDLLIETLKFFDNLLRDFKDEWYKKSNNTYNGILLSAKKIINSCFYVIMRPKNIMMYQLDQYFRLNHMERIPIALMVGVMNRLISAAGLAISIIYRANPSIVDLMEPYIPDTSTIVVINDFSVPKFELPIPYELTYGKLLCLAHFMCKTLDALIFRDPKEITEEGTEKDYVSGCVGVVEHQHSSENLAHQKLSAFLRYAMCEYSGLAEPWIQRLDYMKVNHALEMLMSFLGQQVFLHVVTVDKAELPYFKRNLSSELQFFYEFVKRHTCVLLNQDISVASMSSIRSVSSLRSEMDIMRRYLFNCRERDQMSEVTEKNYCLLMFHWFTGFCHIC